MARRNVTDRAHRYRARNLAPAGAKVCALCGSRSNLTVDHKDGHPDHTTRGNLQWLCKSCNTAKGFWYKSIGKGRLTHQYNPAEGVPTYEQYAWAVAQHTRGAHDEGGVIIHATPLKLRSEYARRIASTKRARGRMADDERWNAARRENIWPFRDKRLSAKQTTPAHGGAAYHSAKRAGAKPAAAKGAASGLTAEVAAALVGLGASKSEAKAAAASAARAGGDFDAVFRRALGSLAKANPAKFDRCVKAVQAKGGAGNAYAVCTAAGTRNPNATTVKNERDIRKYIDAKVAAGWSADQLSRAIWRRWGYLTEVKDGRLRVKFSSGIDTFSFNPSRKNPATAAADAYEEFHGHPSKEIVTVTKQVHVHEHLASAGELRGMTIKGIDGRLHEVKGFKKALLAFNESKNQLFVEGGDQSLNLADFGIRKPHELETLGKLVALDYFTTKDHLGDEGGTAVYSHKLRTTNQNGQHVVVTIARYPDVIYRTLDEQFEFSGGSYVIRAEGIDK